MTETPVVETPEVPSVSLSPQQAQLFKLMVDQLAQNATEHNEIVQRMKELSTDPVEVAQAIRDNSTDEQVVEYRTKIDRLSQALDDLEENFSKILADMAQKKINESQDADKYKELDAKRVELAEYVKAGKKMLEIQSKEHAAQVPDLISRKGGAVGSHAGRGAGVPRYRGLTVFWRQQGNPNWTRANKKSTSGENVSTFGEAAKAIGAESIKVIEAYHASTGKTERKDFPPDHTYTYSVNDKIWEIRVVEDAD